MSDKLQAFLNTAIEVFRSEDKTATAEIIENDNFETFKTLLKEGAVKRLTPKNQNILIEKLRELRVKGYLALDCDGDFGKTATNVYNNLKPEPKKPAGKELVTTDDESGV